MNARIRPVIFSAALLALSGRILLASDAGEAFNPAVHPAQRYQHIWEKSPFVTAAPVVQESGGLAQRFALTGVASVQNQPVIFVLDRQSLSRLVVTGVRNQQGLELVSVENQTDPEQSRATIRLGMEQTVIRYDVAALQGVNPLSENPKPAPADAAVTSMQAAPKPAPRGVRVITRKPINLTN
ncbi:MAG: hypothetical protein WCQ57_02165 [Verrucomicrobiota bacterium]